MSTPKKKSEPAKPKSSASKTAKETAAEKKVTTAAASSAKSAAKPAAKAEKQLGWSYNSIKKVCDGKTKHTHNRYFRYSNPLKRELLKERNKEYGLNERNG